MWAGLRIQRQLARLVLNGPRAWGGGPLLASGLSPRGRARPLPEPSEEQRVLRSRGAGRKEHATGALAAPSTCPPGRGRRRPRHAGEQQVTRPRGRGITASLQLEAPRGGRLGTPGGHSQFPRLPLSPPPCCTVPGSLQSELSKTNPGCATTALKPSTAPHCSLNKAHTPSWHRGAIQLGSESPATSPDPSLR